MRKKVKRVGIVVLFVLLGTGLLFAESENGTFTTTAPGSIQDSSTINKYNYALNKEIIRLYKTLEGYNLLYKYFKPSVEFKEKRCIEKRASETAPKDKMNKSNDVESEYARRISRIPQQTILRWIKVKDLPANAGKAPASAADCKIVALEIENYGFVYPREKQGWGEPIGSNFRKVRLFFTDKKLTKVVSSIGMRDFKNHTTKNFYITHNDINTEYKDDKSADTFVGKIHFKFVNTHKIAYEKLIKDMSNVISNPNQVLFKKEFYVRHLEHFENLYRKTMDYQKDLLEDLDKNLIKEMQSTLDF